MDRVKLGDIAILINGDRGKNYPSQSDISAEGDIPFVNAGHLNGRSVDFSEMNYISKDKYDKLNSGKFVQGDILYCLRGSLGKKAIVSDNIVGAIASSLVIIRPDNNVINGQYLMFSLDARSIKKQLEKANNGSSQPNLSAASVRDYRIELPSLSIQTEIVNRLSKARYLIDRRTHELELLDNLIKARFVELFGDPCSNPMGHTKMTIKEAIDAGYIEKPLDGNHGEKHPKASEYVDDGVPFVMANNLVDGVVDYDSCSKITRERADKLDKGFSHDGDVLITHKGTIGRTAIVHTKLDYIMLTPQVTYYRPLKGIIAEYLKGYFDTDFFQGEMKKLAAAGGSTRAYVGITNQTQLQLVIPNQDLQTQYAEFVEQVDKSKIVVQKSMDEAQLLFDSLMQKYFG